MASIRALCKHGVLLENGSVKATGEVNDIVDLYLEDQYRSSGRIIDNIEFIAGYIQIDDFSINGERMNPIRLTHENPVLHLHIEGMLKCDANMAIEFRLTDKNGTPLVFYSPSHYSGESPRFREGCFVIDENIHLPEQMNQGSFYGDLWITDPGKAYHLQMPNGIHIEHEGFPMKTGKVIRSAAGFVFEK